MPASVTAFVAPVDQQALAVIARRGSSKYCPSPTPTDTPTPTAQLREQRHWTLRCFRALLGLVAEFSVKMTFEKPGAPDPLPTPVQASCEAIGVFTTMARGSYSIPIGATKNLETFHGSRSDGGVCDSPRINVPATTDIRETCTFSPDGAELIEIAPVGGIAVDPELSALPLEAEASAGGGTSVVAGAAIALIVGAVALGGAARYASTRRSTQRRSSS